MAELLVKIHPPAAQYRDRRFDGTQEAFEEALNTSTTVYVGNLSFFTTEEQIYEVFSKTGDIKRIIMGLDRQKMTPCGFCFVVYYSRPEAADCVKYLNGSLLDDRAIRIDFDWGFRDGRQFGRGRSGGQVRDEYRMDYDAGRGGYGTVMRQELESRQQMLSALTGGMGGDDDPESNPRFAARGDEDD